jgi:hypothetical protein
MTSDERDLGAMRQSASRQIRIGLGCSYLDTDGESLPIHVIINKHSYYCIKYGAINFVERVEFIEKCTQGEGVSRKVLCFDVRVYWVGASLLMMLAEMALNQAQLGASASQPK